MADLRGSIDRPAPGENVARGVVPVVGWHAIGDKPALVVVISVQGEVRGSALVGGVERPDVAETFGHEELARSGWTVDVDLSDMPLGPAELHVSVWGGPGQAGIDAGTIPVVVHEGQAIEQLAGPLGNSGLPAEGTELEPGMVTFSGWAMGRDGPVDHVEVFVDGSTVGRARLGLARPDVFDVHTLPWARSSGFEQQVDLVGRAGTSTRITVVATQSDGTDHVLGERVLAIVTRPTERKEKSAARLESLRAQLPRLLAALPTPPIEDLNLLVVTHQLDYGGAQLWLTELLEKSGAGKNFPCTVLSPVDGPLGEDLVDSRIDVHVTRPFIVTDIEQYEGQVTEMGAWARARGQNSVLVNTFGSFVGADVALRLGVPAVWAIHESWSPPAYWAMVYPPEYVDPEVRRVADRALAETPAVVFEAEATRRLYASFTRPGAALVVPYGVDTERIEKFCAGVDRMTARRELGLPEQGRVILVMGTTEPRKAQLLVAQAFAGMAARYPDTTLALVGDTGTLYAETLKDLVRGTGLEEQIRVVPVVPDPFPWYRAANVLLCASDVESLPRSVLDAMCFGVGIVATSVFGLPELLTDGETGYLFEPRSTSALVAALRRVLDLDRASLEAVAAAGRRHVMEHYDSHGYATDIPAILLGLLRDPSQQPAHLIADRSITGVRPA